MNENKNNILQFGEGNFLRGFFDYGLQNLKNKGIYNSKLTVVSPIDSDFIIEKLNNQNGKYTVSVAGINNGEEVKKLEEINVIDQSFNAYKDWDSVLMSALDPQLKLIISNTTEAGIAFNADDSFDSVPNVSFPAKLTKLLFERYNANADGVIILPCELIEKNGETLRDCILNYSQIWDLGNGFNQYITDECLFYNTLVDRIVPGYPKDQADSICAQIRWDDQLIVKVEPFAFFGIERVANKSANQTNKLESLFNLSKADLGVTYTDNLKAYRERKVHLLNAPHTAMSMIGLQNNIETVEQMVCNEPYKTIIHKLMFDEIIPMLDLPKDQLNEFAKQVWDRFKNPYNRHELSSIALNEQSKYEVRVLPIIQRYQNQNLSVPEVLQSLMSIANSKWGI